MVDDVTREEIREGQENQPKRAGGKGARRRLLILSVVIVAIGEAGILTWVIAFRHPKAEAQAAAPGYDPSPWMQRVADRVAWTFDEISEWCEPLTSAAARDKDRRFSAEFIVYVEKRFHDELEARGEDFLAAAKRTARLAIKAEMGRLGPELKKPSVRLRFGADLVEALNKIEPFRGGVILGVDMDRFQAARY
ncbi:MAG: hypothetical protein JXP34_20375 [Planctomycetes bacterium]|nr:hypothetical protein [Planctomycetota bacterium]